jgi:threonine dehydrogenase-like Zn-dependent dehydrogenase
VKRVFACQGQAVVRDVPEPSLRPGEVLVRTAVSTISSGTETLILKKSALPGAKDEEYPGEAFEYPHIRSGVRLDAPLPRPPVPGLISLGYSLAGQVVATGDGVVDLKKDDWVACSGSQCSHHAEMVAVPRNLVASIPDGVSPREAAFVTLGAISTEAVRRTGCTFGETIAMYGLGLLGLLATQIARSAGFHVLGLDIDERRLATARELGASATCNPALEDPRSRARAMTDGLGVDAVILTAVTESSEPLNTAFELCRQRGSVVGVGVFGMNIDRSRMGYTDYRLAVAYGPGRYDPAYEEGNVDYPIGYVRWTENRNMGHFLRLLAERQVTVAPLAPIQIPIERAPEAYDLLRSPDRPPTVQLVYGDA